MSDQQIGSMMVADDAYAGSASFERMEAAILEVFNEKYVLPVHQGRAAENIISKVFVKPGDVVPMNYHFTTTRAHIEINGGQVLEIYTDEALKLKSSVLFKGNIDINRLKDVIKKYGKEKIPFIRMEASTNLIGGQPFSIQNMRDVRKVANDNGIMMVLDASLIGENAYFIKLREDEFKKKSIKDILHTMCGLSDMIYFSSRKVSSTRGGAIATNKIELFNKMKDLVPLFV
jgi:tyrosine phenol-lyase